MGQHLNIYFGLTILLVTTLLTINFDASGQDLTVKFYNMTGYDVDQILVGETFVGSIPRDSVSDFISFPGFLLDSSTPIEPISAILNHSYINNYKRPMCATMWRTLTTGELYVDITIYTYDGNDYLLLKRHQ